MTGQQHGSLLLQARDSQKKPHSHSHAQSHLHSHSFLHRFRRKSSQLDVQSQQSRDGAPDQRGLDKPVEAERNPGSINGGDVNPAEKIVAANVIVNAASQSSDAPVKHVVQTVSLVQYVDPWGSPYKTSTLYGPPNTVVVDPKSGKTLSSSSDTHSSVILASSTAAGTSVAASSPSASIKRKSTSASASASSTPTHVPYPIVGEIRNSTNSKLRKLFHKTVHRSFPVPTAPFANELRLATFHIHNSTFIPPANSSSIYKPLLYQATSSLSTSSVGLETTSETRTSSIESTSSSEDPSRSTSALTSCSDDAYGTITVTGGLPTWPPTPAGEAGSSGHSVESLTRQQKQVIGGVVGAVAGVAVFGLLLMLFLRYKRRSGDRITLDGHSTTTRSIGDGTSGCTAGATMAERSAAASGAIAAALASLTGKKPPPAAEPGAGEERGFYRVSGRKLPSILHSGGDGYSDPRESAASEYSDYHGASQAFQPRLGGATQLALGSPMRPVSGIPVIRSGPARNPITKDPFAVDDAPATPSNKSSRTLASRESPRASGSRFQEGI
ncbi:hypothetical protein UVI_02030790 [Ustilaginoidea virens]|uniref:Uncharacterized protein n=1 Tax=Ustilaginoidea virens TaxID=1159556 RepID=A0A1B5L5V0_USTVR|nr:hypothetical protein UVI_02030790 [Ustilaginoidea virens]